jgi:pyruvate dehydrogenase E1 component alpha subunit
MATARASVPKEKLLWMYETMVLIRRFEEQAKREADQGRILGTHSAIGEEAVPTGICAHLRDDDYVLGNHRSHHHCIAKGVGVKEMMAELLGKVTGTNRGKGGTMHIADATKGMLGANGVVGSNIPVATGCALAAKVQGRDSVSVVFFGDGASSQGSLHEAMNLASIWDLPVIFICENNRYAESTPYEYAVAGKSVASRAAGYAMPGVTVDGQDVMEMYEVSGEAVARARQGEGPTLIEALTYRYHGHYGADNPLGYRSEEEEVYYKDRDCIDTMAKFLLESGIMTRQELDEIDRVATGRVEEASRFAVESPYPDPSEILSDVYVNYP